ncbi:hypothetical protein [Kitasatospora brasiliensis]|uniref:hypothetical protein n=1 Tax=Kitasatospora brasiliensis TaxID=3058040 RepID=UPI00292D7CD1|nr:hypothetical protein [Kitasatospora sp. K002]
MSTDPDVLDGEFVDGDGNGNGNGRMLPATRTGGHGIDVGGFDRDTVLVAGRPLPAPFVAPAYAATDFVISEDTAQLLAESTVPNTERNHRARIRVFQRWCAERGRVALPCTTATLIEYVGWMVLGGVYDPNTVSDYHSAVVTWQERETPGNTRPGTIQTSRMIAAFRRKWSATKTEKQSPAVLEADLEEMLADCDEDHRHGIGRRDAAILAMGWHLLSRRIELARLVPVHAELHPDGIAVRLVARKTRKDGSVFEAWIPARDDAPQLCPARRLRAWLEYARTIRMPLDQALFRALDKAGQLQVRLTPQTRPKHPDGQAKADHEITAEEWVELSYLSGDAVNAIVKTRARNAYRRVAGLGEQRRVDLGHNALLHEDTAKAVTAHGLRAGGASALREADVPEDQIAEMGDWRKDSAAMRRYFRRIRVRKQNPWAAARAGRSATL